MKMTNDPDGLSTFRYDAYLDELEMYKAIGENLIALRMMEKNPVDGKSLFDDQGRRLKVPLGEFDKYGNTVEGNLPWIIQIWNQIFSPKKQRG